MTLYQAVLFDRSTGERSTVVMDFSEDADPEYMFTEGNYGCDCNRRLFMARAAGRPDPDPSPCGETIVMESFGEAPAGAKVTFP